MRTPGGLLICVFLLLVVFVLPWAHSGLLAARQHDGQPSLLLVPETVGLLASPDGWSLKVWAGEPEVRLTEENQKLVFHLHSVGASVSVYKHIELPLGRLPILSWRWKVTKLPAEADARVSDRDDQAAALYVIFPRFPSFLRSRAIGYIWENTLPPGTVMPSPSTSRVRYIVVRSGHQHLGTWFTEERDMLKDYRELFGEEPPRVGGVSLMIDSDDTYSEAESFFTEIEAKSSSGRK